MRIDAIAPAAQASSLYTNSTQRAPKQVMDSEVFMSLLVTQLRNQDPSSPMDTNQMISQTTQLASMEKLTNLDTVATENFSLQMRTAAAALIGAEVSWADKDGTKHSGTATAVSFAGPVPQITVGEATIALDAISGIKTIPPGTATPPASTTE